MSANLIGAAIAISTDNLNINAIVNIINSSGSVQINGGVINTSDSIVIGTGANRVYIGGSGVITFEDIIFDPRPAKSGGDVLTKGTSFGIGPQRCKLNNASLNSPSSGASSLTLRSGQLTFDHGDNVFLLSHLIELPNIRLTNLPTSASGLDPGTPYRDPDGRLWVA